MTRGVRRDARILYEGKRGGHSVTTTSEALDRLTGTTAPNSTAEALDRHQDTAPEALDRLRSRDSRLASARGSLRSPLARSEASLRSASRLAVRLSEALPAVAPRYGSLRAAPFGRRACFVVLSVPGLALRIHQDSTAPAPRSSPADSFGARCAPASLVPRTVPAGGRLGDPRRPPASARHVSTGYTFKPGQPIAWRTERARRAWRRSRHDRGGRRSRPPARAEGASLRRPYPSGEAEGAPRPRPRTPGTASEASRNRGARISGIATASAPRAFEAVAGGVVSPGAWSSGPRAFGVVGLVDSSASGSAPRAFEAAASPAWLPRSEERVTGSNIDETEDAVSTEVHT
jgi:hypothetical protein